jgi:hypothetical protein
MRLNQMLGGYRLGVKHMNKINSPRSPLPGILMVIGGLVLILCAPISIQLFRGTLSETSPRALSSLWYGMGGLLLLYLTAGLPLGAILLAAGGARLYSTDRAGRVLLPLLAVLLVLFMFDVVRLKMNWNIPILLFGIMGGLFIVLFLAQVWDWARRRPSLESQRRRVADLQLGAGVCFFSAAWQACGLAGAPGFALYPEIVQKLSSQSFVGGQVFAVQFLMVLGFVFLLFAMRAEWAHKPAVSEQDNKHDEATNAS